MPSGERLGHVGACAERRTRVRQHDDPDVVALGGSLQVAAELLDQLSRQRVAIGR